MICRDFNWNARIPQRQLAGSFVELRWVTFVETLFYFDVLSKTVLMLELTQFAKSLGKLPAKCPQSRRSLSQSNETGNDFMAGNDNRSTQKTNEKHRTVEKVSSCNTNNLTADISSQANMQMLDRNFPTKWDFWNGRCCRSRS